MATRTATPPHRAASPRPISQRPRALATWLSERAEAVAAPVTTARIGAGRTNVNWTVTDRAGRQWVLRERGLGQVRDFTREATTLRALTRFAVPVARVVGHDGGRAGSPFMVTTRVTGITLHTEDDARRLTPPQRHALGTQVIATLAHLHSIDPRAVGLPTPSVGYLDRQMARLTDVWTRAGSSGSHDSAWRAVRARLIERQPERQPRAMLLHGDFRLANLIIGSGAIGAVVDWELCTAGDPIADLAWLLTDWRSPGEPATCPPSPTRVGGFPSREDLVTAYQRATGLPLHSLDYHRGWAQWRAATLLQAQLTQHRAHAVGDTPPLDTLGVDDTIAQLLLGAATFLRGPR